MTDTARTVQRTYLVLTLFTTLAASFIWGINTLFLLDAGLDNTQAFTVNAFFTVGQVLFEVPTGVVADTRGRRFSFLLGAGDAARLDPALPRHVADPGAACWAGRSPRSCSGSVSRSSPGATEAWLVDALRSTGLHRDPRIGVRARPDRRAAWRCSSGSVLGGVIAQVTNLGVPYLIRAALLGVTMVIAWWFMHDLGFTPSRGVRAS